MRSELLEKQPTDRKSDFLGLPTRSRPSYRDENRMGKTAIHAIRENSKFLALIILAHTPRLINNEQRLGKIAHRTQTRKRNTSTWH